MLVRVLGPLEVLVGGRPVPPPPPAERELLVILVLAAGRVVPAETLIDSLWGPELPADPMNALQVRVSKLRRALAVTGLVDVEVTHRSSGYALGLEPGEVDAHRFTSLVAEARRLADHAPALAARRYEQSLALWRGTALAGFGGQAWAEPEIGRLEQLRLAANEEYLELVLAGGRHTEVLGDLETLVARHPLREGLHRLLMLALYRSGRQAEALAAFSRARAQLADELGIDPSAELVDLQQAILRHDPRLDPPVVSSVDHRPRRPARLTSLVGRTTEVAQAAELLREHRLVTLTGPGGVGKTSVALEVLDPSEAEFPDGVWLVELAGVAQASGVARAVSDALGLPHGADDEEALVQFLKERTALVLLDNCEHLVDRCAALTRRLLEASPGLRVLATSREPLAVPGEVQLPISPLATPPPDAVGTGVAEFDSVRLFDERARAARPGFDLAETATAVARICQALDGIPLGIELAAALVTSLPADQIAARLDDRYALLTAGPRTSAARQQTLRATMDWSHQLLTGPEQILFRRLAVFRGGWTLEAAEGICAGAGLDPAHILGLLVRLVDRSLVVVDHSLGGRFRLLETLRHYAHERLVEAGEQDVVARAHSGFLAAAAEAGKPLLRGPDQRRWLMWLRDERDNLRIALTWCRSHSGSDPDLGLRLVAALGWFWYFASQPPGTEITAMLAATQGGSSEARGLALQAQALAGRPGSCVVHPSLACAPAARESLSYLTQVGDAQGAAYSRVLVAVEGIGGSDADVDAAEDLLDAAAGIFDRVGDPWGTALVSFVRMELEFARGRPDDAADHAEQALVTFRRLGDHWGVSAIQYHHGIALHRAGRVEQALRMYEGALREGRELGLANTVQYAVAAIGHVTLLLGDPTGAVERFTAAHAIGRELGAEGNPLASLGEAAVARQCNDLGAARDHYAEALRLLGEQDKPDWRTTALTGLGLVAELSGDLDAARSYHDQASATARANAAANSAPAALEASACLAATRGDGRTAAGLLGMAAHWRRRRGWPATTSEQREIGRATDRSRELLGQIAFLEAYEEPIAVPHRVPV